MTQIHPHLTQKTIKKVKKQVKNISKPTADKKFAFQAEESDSDSSSSSSSSDEENDSSKPTPKQQLPQENEDNKSD